MTKYYYDTSLVLHFMYNDEELESNSFSPIAKKPCYTSFLTLQEAVNVYINRGAITEYHDKHIDFKEFIYRLNKLETYFEIFESTNLKINFNVIKAKLLKSLISMSESGIDMKADKDKGEKVLNGMDLMHLLIADYAGCDIFLTEDSGFRYIKRIANYIEFNKLERIFIFKSREQLKEYEEIQVKRVDHS